MASATPAENPTPLDVLPWLKTLPLAPEYHPTLAEFQDPISYILKIEKEASSYGICKIVPPLPAPPRKTAVSNLNRSFAARNGAGCGGPRKVAPTFTTRQQQIGFCPRKSRPAQRPVWQSGEQYTLQQFEARAKQFEKTQMKRFGRKGGFSPLEVETLFWKASADKPFMVEYANDMPGSGFAPLLLHSAAKKWREEDTCNVGHTMWNMRGVSRAKGSLLEFMKEEIPGVTSPMVYVAMLFSWFAWHVEDHELHSLNYMHIGAGKTWYGVPRDAGLAFEEVVRVHGYGGEVNPLVTFATLGEKTTVMSPEVLIGAGVPCCRLVQNAGEFVITFPGSYHCGFSHGFNCGEAANVATPEWLKVAKEAAVRRASINYPPMVSHFQLLYDLALSLWSRIPLNNVTEPRSSRLKDKMKGEGEVMIKELFVENAIQNNNLLHILLGKGSSCVVLPQNTLDVSFHSNPRIRSQAKFKPRISLDICSHNEEKEASTGLSSEGLMFGRSILHKHPNASSYMNKSSFSVCQEKKHHCVRGNNVEYAGSCTTYNTENTESNDKGSAFQSEGLLDQGLLSCVACGILSFACVAIIQPTDAAAVHLMSADCSSFDNQSASTTFIFETRNDKVAKANTYELTPASERVEKSYFCGFMDNLEDSSHHLAQHSRQVVDSLSETVVQKGPSALDLLASAYGNSSDSEENIQHENLSDDETDFGNSSLSSLRNQNPKHLHNGFSSRSPHPGEHEEPTLSRTDVQNEAAGVFGDPSSRFFSCNQFDDVSRMMNDTVEYISPQNKLENAEEMGTPGRSNVYVGAPFSTEVTSEELNNSCLITEKADVCQRNTRLEIPSFRSEQYSVVPDSCHYSNVSANEHAVQTAQCNKLDASLLTSSNSFMHRPDKDSSRMHIFCLEHALEVENQLRPLGGAHVMILCHPDYPKLEAEAKTVAEELRINYKWKDIHFKDATKEDQEKIQSALEDEEVIPSNSDWAVKMHVNLYYSSNLSRSPLYSKQLPYNAVIYKAFGCNSSGGSPKKLKVFHRRRGRQKKITVAGKWCGKVWMSNQVHPYLAYKNNPEEQEHVEAFELEDTGQELVEADIDYANQAGTSTRDSFDDIKTAAKSSTGKRKTSMNNSKAKKAKYDKLQTDLEDSTHNSSAKCGRVLRGKTRLPSTPLHDDCEMTGRRKLSLNDESEGGPSTRLRRRSAKIEDVKPKKTTVEKQIKKKGKEASVKSSVTKDEGAEYMCDVDGCSMSFTTKQDLVLHKRNICPVKGCGKKFFSHKYLVQHRRVHMDDRPLKCPWKGCKMTFKWAWARTEHIRVHTGDRPYICMERGCGQTFRFVSDFSRHKRKTGHVSKKGRR